MSRVYSDTVLPEDSGVSQDLTLGTTGDTVQVTAGASLNVNTLKDSGGNTLFTSDGSGTLSSLNSGFTGLPTLIATQTFDDVAYVDYTSCFSETYKLYIIKIVGGQCETAGYEWGWSVSPTAQVTTCCFFISSHSENDSSYASLAFSAAGSNVQGSHNITLSSSNSSDADAVSTGDLFLFHPTSTVTVKHFHSRMTTMKNSAVGIQDEYNAGYVNTTSAMESIRFYNSSANTNITGTIKIYGL